MEILTAATAMALEDFTSSELAALNNSITGFGTVGKEVVGFERAVESGILHSGGRPCDKESLLAALSFEINQRLDRGSFKP